MKPSWLDGYRFGLRMTERGEVVSVGDGIARVRGLPSAAMSELLRFAGGSRALVFALDEETLGAIMLEGSDEVVAGQQVYLTGRTLGIGVGEELLGRVLDPLGSALDGMPDPQASERRHLEAASPPIVAREFVETPLYTGNKIIDGLVPIGKGQRQLLIGDNGLGKTSVALDVVLNQKDKGVLCVYVLIGQKRSTVAGIIETLRQHDAMGYTVVVVAEATATPGLKYLAPFAGCSIAEYWMLRGRDTLIVYDDLTMHAQAYRELSLLLKRPPGREAYPGDVFYLHSRLLERSTHLKATHGGGSMTALPIGETQEGEIASYIPTNLISITDGQVYFDSAQFSSGALPAIDVRRSVSRIGGKAQDPLVRKEAARMKLDYLQFLELEVFTRFGARLEASAEKRIARGRVLRELLTQDRLAPLPIEAQVAWMIAFNDGRFDGSDAAEIRERFAILAERSRDSGLGLSDDRDTWSREVAAWLGQAGETGETGETGESPP
ncbi:MAG: F0F1 ATP synthase subunit alpha [Gammaproteobacteria bacterium]